MRILKKTAAALIAVALIILPLALVLGVALLVPTQYDKLFHSELDDKLDRLRSIDEEKIVVVGGSSVAFGLDSALLEECLGMPVVNFGLYASLGTKIMLDLSIEEIDEGDIVIIAPETDSQTMSLYFSGATALEALDSDPSMLSYIKDESDRLSLLGALFEHSGRKLGYFLEGAPDPDGVYNSDSFNKYGDIDYERPENVMDNYHEMGKTITLDESLIDKEFFDYVNEYIRKCRDAGAEVYYSFCPMNSLAMDEKTDEESLREFEELLMDELDCRLISYASDYILDPGYFYDTNYHLNDTGVIYRTLRLADDIMLARGEPVYIAADYPDPPALKDGIIVLDGYDENEKYFTYEELPNGNYMITGLSGLGIAQSEITLPVGVRIADTDKQIAVTAIGEGAFADGNIKRLTVSADSELRQIMNGAFKDSGIERLDIYISDAESILPPTSFAGTDAAFAVYVPEGSSYTTDYYWSQVKVKIVEELEA